MAWVVDDNSMAHAECRMTRCTRDIDITFYYQDREGNTYGLMVDIKNGDKESKDHYQEADSHDPDSKDRDYD